MASTNEPTEDAERRFTVIPVDARSEAAVFQRLRRLRHLVRIGAMEGAMIIRLLGKEDQSIKDTRI